MSWWAWIGDSFGAVLLVALAYGSTLVVRRRVLSRNGGTFELSVRVHTGRAGRGWALGLGRYAGGRLEWFRIFSVWPRPRQAWDRHDLTFESQRAPEGGERLTLYAGHVVVVCATPDGPVELAMSPSALMGLQSWLEAAPPGSQAPMQS